MISHDKARALISARYDQLLAAADTRNLHEHLAGCAACRRFAADTDLLVNSLRTLPSLPPSPRVSRAVRDGIRGSAESPWGWLGQALRIAGSPTLAVASSLVLVAALAFIIVLALRPLGLDEQPRATISALADVIETPTTEPERTPFAAPTMAPTEPVVAAPTQEPTPEPTPEPTARLTNVTPPTQTPAPTAPAEPEPTQRSIVTRAQSTVAPVVETPEPTVAPPPVATQPPAPIEEAPTTVIEAANQAVTAEPTAPPIASTTDGAPFIGEEPVATEEGAAPPVFEQPAIEPGGPDGGAVADTPPTAEPNVADNVAIMAGPEPTAADDAGESQAAEAEPQPTAPPQVVPTSTPIEIVAAEGAPAPAAAADEPPQLPERSGNEAIGMDGESMVAEIQATVQAGLADDSGPPPVPTSAPPPTSAAQADLTPGTGDPALAVPAGAEITGAPASDSLATGSEPISSEALPAGESAPITTDAAPAGVDPAAGATVELAPTAPPLEQAPAPTQAIVAAGWPSIDGSVPIWSPDGTSMLVIGADGLGAVWDANAGAQIPVERPAVPARDLPVGWYGGEPLVQRVYLDGSGRVELRVVPISGAGGYVLGTATADSVFGEGVIAARLSPDGGQLSFVSGGQLYIAPVSDPGNASPAG